MNISLTPILKAYVEEKMLSGQYHSASEVIRAGLRALQEQEDLKKNRLQELRHEIQLGIDALDRGEKRALTLEQAKTELNRRLTKRKKVA